MFGFEYILTFSNLNRIFPYWHIKSKYRPIESFRDLFFIIAWRMRKIFFFLLKNRFFFSKSSARKTKMICRKKTWLFMVNTLVWSLIKITKKYSSARKIRFPLFWSKSKWRLIYALKGKLWYSELHYRVTCAKFINVNSYKIVNSFSSDFEFIFLLWPNL